MKIKPRNDEGDWGDGFSLLLSMTITNSQYKYKEFPADLVTFTEEIFNGKLHFL